MKAAPLVLLASLLPLFGEAAAVDVFAAIRDDDRMKIKEFAGANANLAMRDRNGVTPLLYASAMGSVEAMKLLIQSGADVNSVDNGGSSPLLWAACDPVRVSLLLKNGANAKGKTMAGRTPLMAAAHCQSAEESVRLLLAAGADVNAVADDKQTPLIEASLTGGPRIMRMLLAAGAKAGTSDGGGFTCLMAAVGWNDVELVRQLLAKGAAIHAKNTFAGKVVHGDIALRELTALMLASAYGSPALVKVLLDAGAEINARDVRGMSPLLFAVSSSNQDARVVKLLLERGSDVNNVSVAGETALDWARKFGSREVISILERAGAKGRVLPAMPVRTGHPEADARRAAEKSVRLLQDGADSFFAKSNCVACHHQPMAAAAVRVARDAGVPVNERQMDMMKKSMVALLAPRPSAVLGMQVGPPGTDGLTNTTLALAAAGQEPGLLTDSSAAYLAARQSPSGAWEESNILARAPMTDSVITRTVYAMRAMQLYAIPSRKAEFDERVARTRKWLLNAKARNSYERAEILLGLAWAGAEPQSISRAAAAVAKDQQSDGGWAQSDGLATDAYATALALRALREAGAADRHSPLYERGVAYLLRTQMEDGSWYVRSRAVKLQPYFQSGFPYDHEQWISYVATANATMALLR